MKCAVSLFGDSFPAGPLKRTMHMTVRMRLLQSPLQRQQLKTLQLKMAILELRPLKLGIKGLSHQSRLERRLRARVKTNTALCPLVIWMKSGTWKSVCVGPASVVGQ